MAVLNLLWRRRRRVAVGALLAVVLAAALGRSTTPPSAIATTGVVVDTPQSQIATADPRGVETLSWRATLLGMRLGTDKARQQIASELRVPLSDVAATDLELTAPTVPASLPTAAAQAATAISAPYTITVRTDDVVPIVAIEASAPDGTAATRLALAAVHALQTGTSPQDTPDVQGLSVRQAAPIVVRPVAAKHARKKGAAVALLFFVMWCVCVALGPAVARAIRPITDPHAART